MLKGLSCLALALLQLFLLSQYEPNNFPALSVKCLVYHLPPLGVTLHGTKRSFEGNVVRIGEVEKPTDSKDPLANQG